MATTTAGAAHGLPHRNNGATVVYGGNVDSSPTVTQVLSKETTGYHSGVHGATVPESANFGTHKPYSGGTFRYQMEAGKFVGMRYTGYISGVANTVLERGAGGGMGRRSIHWLESYRRLDITSWNYVTGAATKGVNAGASVTYKNIRGSGNVDDAAHPTRAIPGEYVFTDHHLAHSGALAVALNGDYPAKTD